MREGGPEPGRFPQGRGNRSPQGKQMSVTNPLWEDRARKVENCVL